MQKFFTDFCFVIGLCLVESVINFKKHPMLDHKNPSRIYGTTILSVRKNGRVAIAGDGQVSLGATVLKSNAKKIRKLGDGSIIGGFAGATADAFTLFERLESKLELHPNQLKRACVELAKDWRTDKILRRLEALLTVADASWRRVSKNSWPCFSP